MRSVGGHHVGLLAQGCRTASCPWSYTPAFSAGNFNRLGPQALCSSMRAAKPPAVGPKQVHMYPQHVHEFVVMLLQNDCLRVWHLYGEATC